MNRKEYMDADKLTGGIYDGSKGHDVHHAYFAQFVTPEITATVLHAIGGARLLQSRDVHLNDIPLQLWDRLPFPRVGDKLRELGENSSLSTQVCIYKTAARLWLKANGGLPLWRVRYTYPQTPGDRGTAPHYLYSYAVGRDPDDARQNFARINSGTVGHVIIDNGGTPLNEKVKP